MQRVYSSLGKRNYVISMQISHFLFVYSIFMNIFFNIKFHDMPFHYAALFIILCFCYIYFVGKLWCFFATLQASTNKILLFLFEHPQLFYIRCLLHFVIQLSKIFDTSFAYWEMRSLLCKTKYNWFNLPITLNFVFYFERF